MVLFTLNVDRLRVTEFVTCGLMFNKISKYLWKKYEKNQIMLSLQMVRLVSDLNNILNNTF